MMSFWLNRSLDRESRVMSGEAKKKLCWNCEGLVALHLENCPYCGVYLSPTETATQSMSSFDPPFPSSSFKPLADAKPPFQQEDEKNFSTEPDQQKGLLKGFMISLVFF